MTQATTKYRRTRQQNSRRNALKDSAKSVAGRHVRSATADTLLHKQLHGLKFKRRSSGVERNDPSLQNLSSTRHDFTIQNFLRGSRDYSLKAGDSSENFEQTTGKRQLCLRLKPGREQSTVRRGDSPTGSAGSTWVRADRDLGEYESRRRKTEVRLP